MQPPQRYAIWLLPASPDQEELQARIQTVSARFSAVPFPPHLTLFAGTDMPLATIQAALEMVCHGLAPITLQSTSVNISPVFFQTLFVEFAPHPGLLALAERLRQALEPASPRPFQPHLSLLYHDLPLSEKAALRAEIAWEPHPIRFGAVSVVFPPAGERGWYDIAGWKTMFGQTLRAEKRNIYLQ
jgi:putative hydrolase of the HAD superfamily